MNTMECMKVYQSKQYKERVRQLEEEGCCTSDAQSIADVEFNALITDARHEREKGGIK